MKRARRSASRNRRVPTVPAAITLCALGVGALAMTGVRTALGREDKKLQRLREQIAEISREIEQLDLEVEGLLSPRHLEPEARKLGMQPPLAEQLIESPRGLAP